MRVTHKLLKEMEEDVNRTLKESGWTIKVERRHGYYAVDKYDLNGNCLATLEAGLMAKECYYLLRGI